MRIKVSVRYVASPAELAEAASRPSAREKVLTDTVPKLLEALNASKVYLVLGEPRQFVCVQDKEELEQIKQGTELIAVTSAGKLEEKLEEVDRKLVELTSLQLQAMSSTHHASSISPNDLSLVHAA